MNAHTLWSRILGVLGLLGILIGAIDPLAPPLPGVG